MPRPICSPCKVEMYPSTNGVVVVQHFQDPPQPYTLTAGDEYTCTGCGCKVIVGLAQRPYAQHSEESFQEALDRIPANLRRNVYER